MSKKSSKSRWRLNVAAPDGDLSVNLSCRGKSNDVPVLDLTMDTDIICQIGLNVPHKPSDNVFFHGLEGNLVSIPLREEGTAVDYGNPFKLREDCKLLLLFGAMWALSTDPSISSLSFGRFNRYRIQILDNDLISCLDEEAEIHRRKRVRVLLKKYDNNASPEMLRAISANHRNYFTAISAFEKVPRARNFKKQMTELIEEQEKRNVQAKKAAGDIRFITTAVRNLKLIGANTQGLESEIEKLCRALAAVRTISVAELKGLDEEFWLNPVAHNDYHEKEEPKVPYFSGVVKMPTTLHTRTNTGYSPDIITYVVSEPLTDIVGFGGKRIPGFLSRRKIIE